MERLAARSSVQIERLDHLAIDQLTFDLGSLSVDGLDGTLNIGITANALGSTGHACPASADAAATVTQAEAPPPLLHLWPPPVHLKGESAHDTPPAGSTGHDYPAG